MLRISSGTNVVSICKWHECTGCNSPFQFKGSSLVEMSLQALKSSQAAMTDLRRLLYSVDIGIPLTRLNDNQVLSQVAALISTGQLRVCGPEATSSEIVSSDPQQQAVNQVLSALQNKTQNFNFEGKTLRFMSAQQWQNFNGSGQYQIVQQTEAQQIIQKLAAAPVTSLNEKNSLMQAGELIPDSRSGAVESGLYLLHYTPAYAAKTANSEPAVAPSQFAQKQTPTPSAPSASDNNTFSANADVLAIANSMKEAAKSGVPFCEECTKAALQAAALA